MIIGDDQQCLQNELKTVELEESVKKANEELQLCKVLNSYSVFFVVAIILLELSCFSSFDFKSG